MNRPWQIAAVFTACLVITISAMAWITSLVLRLDQAEGLTRREAAQEDDIRLALWRMDSALAPLLVQESARPYFDYHSFYAAGRAYAELFKDFQNGDELIPSALLGEPAPFVLLYFQIAPGGAVTSPQKPLDELLPVALAGHTTTERVGQACDRLERLGKWLKLEELRAGLPKPQARPATPVALANLSPFNGPRPQASRDQQQANAIPRSQRSATEYQNRVQYLVTNNTGLSQVERNSNDPEMAGGPMTPVWHGGNLLLARRVIVGGEEYIQGCWLDWPQIKDWLIEISGDLLPKLDLVPLAPGMVSLGAEEKEPGADGSAVGAEGEADPREEGRLLAALPVRLVPGPLLPDTMSGLTSLRFSLLLVWGAMALAGAAVGLLLIGVVSLSERRASFVSAVTHELRTPLTTFRMYAEMLADGMVLDETRRHHYLETLRAEADRLSHLVENVLGYARLERGRARGQIESLTLRDLLDRACSRLQARAEQAGMQLEVRVPEPEQEHSIRIDVSAAEQVLFNLVDNACKYASSSPDKRITIEAQTHGQRLHLTVRDYGPGISGVQARRLFRPFSKSAKEAAHSAPGVGLGLALSRRLAREMRCELRHERPMQPGAAFTLEMPLVVDPVRA